MQPEPQRKVDPLNPRELAKKERWINQQLLGIRTYAISKRELYKDWSYSTKDLHRF